MYIKFRISLLITGCDSGFGNALVKKLDSIGMNVFAGCLDKDGVGAIGLKNSCSDRYTFFRVCRKVYRYSVYCYGLQKLSDLY